MDASLYPSASTGSSTPSRKRSQECEAGPSRQVHPDPYHGKRPRLTPEKDANERSPEQPQVEDVHTQDAALLYHYALSAHQASQQHLQQAFIPSWVQTRLSGEYDPIPLYTRSNTPKTHRRFVADQQAAEKALALQVFALDLLAIGLKRNDLSDSERAAFSIELITVGMKVMEAQRYTDRKGKGKMMPGVKVDVDRLVEDLHRALAAAMAVCERNSQLVLARQRLEWLNIQLLLIENRVHNAKRIARQYLARCTRSDSSHRYALQFLLLDRAAMSDPGEALSIIDEIMIDATASYHRQVLQTLALARCRLLITYRRWDAMPTALGQMASLLNWDEQSCTSTRLSAESPIWHTVYTAHYLILRSLWEGRIGQDKLARNLLKRLYLLMDEAAESGQLEELRSSGGILQLDGLDPPLHIQTTAPNTLYRLTFLATVTSRRDFVGPASSCKTLIHIRAMRESERTARKDDLWDTGFSLQHGLADVWSAQEGVIMGMAEIMLEEATAIIIRSDFIAADTILFDLADFAHTHDILDTLGPHLCLIQAMMAQLLGHEVAEQYYLAALALLETGSELGLMIEASLLGAQGKLQGIKTDHTRQTHIKDLAARCKLSSSMALNTIGQLLSALADDNLMSAKKKIGGAYDMCQMSCNNLLRALIFAFTSTTHLTGSEDRVQKQLETGLDIATLLGGRDRPDQVGQPVLGLWFAIRLRRQHHRNQRTLDVDIARSKILRYSVRLDEIMEFSRKKYDGASGLGWLGQEVEN